MWELDCEESWALKNWCFWTVVLEKTLQSPLDCKEIQPVHSERDQPWDFFVRNDAEAETPVLWPPHAKSWLPGKDSNGGRDWGQEEKGTTEDDMAGWHHRLDGCESEWTPGVGDGPGGLACCDSRARKESDMTEQLSWTELNARSSWVLYSVLWIMSFSGSASENRHWDHPCVRAGKCSLYLDPQAWVISHTFAVMSNSQNTPDIPLHFFLTVQLSYFW